MPPLQVSSSAARCVRSKLTTSSSWSSGPLRTITARQSQTGAKRSLSSTSKLLSEGHSHESEYDPPSGWLWGIPPGQKPEKEGWETVWHWGFFGSIGLATVAYWFKPDTSIQTWALEEARRRLEAEGILPDPDDQKEQ